jgi:hypothetical protein
MMKCSNSSFPFIIIISQFYFTVKTSAFHFICSLFASSTVHKGIGPALTDRTNAWFNE